MANMSYCRFENTYGDFADCLRSIINRNSLSESEEYYAKELYKLAEAYIDEYEEREEELEEENEE